ncbi:cadherin-like protein 26 isoform X2 [Sturnira hondurensis]|uniref:cadherin-like protein 26 isoform X2 n=1 Tax=Sturnira hondurensis TaxID=192404 RepID=UPI001879F0F7|nr:cadherin-like protein 26 isoform X2 [Sturnira hondurensis]
MGSRAPTSLALLTLPLLLLLPLQVNLINSSQENDPGEQTKGDGHRPLRRFKRRWVVTTLELEEEDSGPFPKLIGELFNNVSDDRSLVYLISGPGVDEYPEVGLFSIEDHKNGRIYVHRPVDREMTPAFMIHVDVASRSAGEIMDSSLILNIRIRDVNDHAPRFPAQELNVSVRENHTAGRPVSQMSAVDLDQENTPNSQVLYFLVSQTPVLKETGFQIDRNSGEIRLSGCLDYETTPRFTLLVRARDWGDPPLSSTATVRISVQDGNNHRPTFPQKDYEIQVPEGQVSPDVLRLRVQDRDSPFTSAWRAEFNISSGNENGHFDIATDPETNEGILNVIKALDFEAHPSRSLIIVVENKEPLFSCEGGEPRRPGLVAASATVSVQVLDANDPPAFHPGSIIISEVEGARPGTQLGSFKATDPEGSGVRYHLAHDPAGWVAVDEHSGAVVTRGQVDRESPYVNDSFYSVIVHAVDDGRPPQTGTGTLLLFLSDINDNAPTLHPGSQHLEVCASSWTAPLLIEAEDRDLEPYADPFTFELDTTSGNAGGAWKLGESQGRSVELFMLKSLPRGDYLVPLFIGDRQGLSQKQTVHVRVCSCHGGSTCVAEAVRTEPGLLLGFLAPLCVVFLVLAVALFFLLRRGFGSGAKRHRCLVPYGEGQQTLVMYNDESRALEAPAVGRSALPSPVTQVSPAPAVPTQPLERWTGGIAEMLHQRLRGLGVLAEESGSLPRIYTEEGECERAETLSSLAVSEQTLPVGLLD